MAKINVKEDTPLELDPKKELERQLNFLETSGFKEKNPVKYASRKEELEKKLGVLLAKEPVVEKPKK